jgi:SRSO17 transposase
VVERLAEVMALTTRVPCPPKGKLDPVFRTKPQLAVDLADAAIAAGVPFRAVVTDCSYGEHPAVQTALWDGAIPSVLAVRAQRGSWAPADDPHPPAALRALLDWLATGRPIDCFVR